jgi:hypothetical protein
MNDVRRSLDDRASKASDASLQTRLRNASSQVDELRRKIVATKEGGAITGEERLREILSNLYGDVVGYEGRPSQTQVERADSLARELANVVKSFDDWSAKDLPGLNAALMGGKLEPIAIIQDIPVTTGGAPKDDNSMLRFSRY